MFCGAQVLIDDEKHHVVYDNAHASGYEFEMGRIQAQNDYITQQERIAHENAVRSRYICPKCSSHHIYYQKEMSHKNTKRMRTYGYCQHCGHVWDNDGFEMEPALMLLIAGAFFILILVIYAITQ